MNTLHHFGDSYADVIIPNTHFVCLISQQLKYNYKGEGKIPGGSNEMILNRLLYNMMDIKEGDILFFNFSFFVRGSYYDRDKKKVMSTNYYYNDVNSTFSFEPPKEYIMDILTHQLDYNEDYNRRLFHQFNTIFERLHHMGVQIYYIFIVENEWSDSLLDYGTKITFPTDFSSWLDTNGYHDQEECHYSRGVQGNICDYVMEQIIKDCPKIIPKLI
jgi:hypothetical protein